MLAIADAEGIVSASIPGLASVSNVEQEAARSAIKTLLEPDPDSRTKDFEGRRIEEIDGGWRILNYRKYRRMLNDEERKEYKAKWIATKRLQQSTNVDSRQSRRKSTQAEAEAEADAEADTETRVHVANWLTNDDLWIELQQILPETEIQNHIGLWIARIKENRHALYESICDFKLKRNQSNIRNIPAWLTQRYQHFKDLSAQRLATEESEKLRKLLSA